VAVDAMIHQAQAVILAFPSAGVLQGWCSCLSAAGGRLHDLDGKEVVPEALASAFRTFLQRLSAWRRGREMFPFLLQAKG
jgi:hypothetical protein